MMGFALRGRHWRASDITPNSEHPSQMVETFKQGILVCGAMCMVLWRVVLWRVGQWYTVLGCMVLRDSKEEDRNASAWENPEWLQQKGDI